MTLFRFKSTLLFLTLLISCKDDEVVICQLSQVNYKNSSSSSLRTYEYADGKLITYTWYQGAVSKFNYGTNGLVTSIENPGGTDEITYDSNGKPSIVTRKQQSTIIETLKYKWDVNSLSIEYTPGGASAPIAIENFEFVNDNISKSSIIIYDPVISGKVNVVQKYTYNDYDNNRNPYYLPTGVWLEYPYPISKNNYKTLVIEQTGYSANGVPQTPVIFTYSVTYQYNSSSFVSQLNKSLSSATGTTTSEEIFTYSNCD